MGEVLLTLENRVGGRERLEDSGSPGISPGVATGAVRLVWSHLPSLFSVKMNQVLTVCIRLHSRCFKYISKQNRVQIYKQTNKQKDLCILGVEKDHQ